jgi:hypothetical protein
MLVFLCSFLSRIPNGIVAGRDATGEIRAVLCSVTGEVILETSRFTFRGWSAL